MNDSKAGTNFVSEAFELTALVFRLAKQRPEYCEKPNEFNEVYLNSLRDTFESFEKHRAVEYAKNLTESSGVAYCAVARLATHLTKSGDTFALRSNLDFLLEHNQWTMDAAAEFARVLNIFYKETGFADFFRANEEYFQKISESFTVNVYSKLNKQWFDRHNLNLSNFHPIIAPSLSSSIYGTILYGDSPQDMVICPVIAVQGDLDDILEVLYVVVHEISHAIGNPLAEKWLAENDEFRILCEEAEKPPNYISALNIAYEYVTRAYTILYMLENEDEDLLPILLDAEEHMGFSRIKEVFDMLKAYLEATK